MRIITVLNYDKYQSANRLLTDCQQTANRQLTGDQQQYKNIKEYKEKKNICGKAATPLSGDEEIKRSTADKLTVVGYSAFTRSVSTGAVIYARV